MRLKSNQCGIVFAGKLTYTMIVATKIYLGGSIMGKFNLNEQIAFLRKAKNVTQEEMAQSLGVTNQSVSKWESAQCCPDIQLLPAIADYFDVSVDELIGHKDAARANNLILQVRSAINELSQGEDSKLALKLVYTINAALFLKRCKWNSEDAVERAGTAEWGRSIHSKFGNNRLYALRLCILFRQQHPAFEKRQNIGTVRSSRQFL